MPTRSNACGNEVVGVHMFLRGLVSTHQTDLKKFAPCSLVILFGSGQRGLACDWGAAVDVHCHEGDGQRKQKRKQKRSMMKRMSEFIVTALHLVKYRGMTRAA